MVEGKLEEVQQELEEIVDQHGNEAASAMAETEEMEDDILSKEWVLLVCVCAVINNVWFSLKYSTCLFAQNNICVLWKLFLILTLTMNIFQ